MYKLFFLLASMFLSSESFAQVQVKLTQPPPNQLKAADLWNATLTNSGTDTIRFTLHGTLEKVGSGLIAEETSRPMSLAPGTKSITYDDLQNMTSASIFDRWGKLISGSGEYTISLQVLDESGTEIASHSILHEVKIVQSEACTTWDLLSSEAVTSTSGMISGESQSIAGMSVFDYNNGQRLWVGHTGWVAGTLDVTRYVEFNTSPITGNNYTISDVSFKYGDSQISQINDFLILNSQVFYSTDNWVTSTALSQTPLVYLNTTMSTFSATNLNIAVAAGQSFSLRIYPYAVKDGIMGTPTFAIHNNVAICGTTTTEEGKETSICGTKFNDLNGDGKQGPNEPGLPGWVIILDGAASQSDTTDARGNYCFTDLKEGEYKVAETNQSGWKQTFPSAPGTHSVALTTGQQIEALNFGNMRTSSLGSICGTKFNDLNGDGKQGADEPGLPGWVIILDGAASQSDTTDARGNYCFTNLKEGVYKVAETNQSGWKQTFPSAPGIHSVALTTGQQIEALNFGNMRTSSLGSICGSKFNDLNGDGKQGADEPGLPGWVIFLDGAASQSDTTDARGNYCFTDLKEGEYKVAETNQSGWKQTFPSAPGTHSVALTTGQQIGALNFGNMRTSTDNGSVGGSVFHDLNTNLLLDPKEPGLSGWSVHLSGAVTGSVLTDDEGSYSFNNLKPGTYTILVDLLGGWEHVGASNGSLSFDLAPGQKLTGMDFGFTPQTCSDESKTWSAMGLGLNNTVLALTEDGTDLYAGGDFTTAGGVTADRIAKWDGTTWSSLGSGLNGRVRALIELDGELYVGGDFTTAGGVTANYIAKWDGTTWSPLGSGVNNPVYALIEMGGELYAGGMFTTAGGTSANRIAKWDGTTWSPLGSGVNNPVYALIEMDGELYAGGDFTTAGGVTANRISKWDGTTWSSLGSGMNGSVFDLMEMGGELYAGGSFTTAGGVSANYIAKWDGASWSALGIGMNQLFVAALATNGGVLYAGGNFTTAGAVRANNIAKYGCGEPDIQVGSVGGTVFDDWNTNHVKDPKEPGLSGWSVHLSGAVTGSVLTDDEGNYTFNNLKLGTYTILVDLLGGWEHVGASNGSLSFDLAPGQKLTGMDFGFTPQTCSDESKIWSALGLGFNHSVYALTEDGTDLYAGGNFTTAGGVTANYITKWDGTTWSPLGSGMNGSVNALMEMGGELYAGGTFTSAGGVSSKYIAKWDGTTWSSLGSGINGQVLALMEMGGELYVGGSFGIAKWNGTTWSPLGSGMNNPVSALMEMGGELYAGGGFITAGGATANHIAKWDGTSWTPLGSGVNGSVHALKEMGGELYAGGWFNMAGGVSASHITKWDGASWSALGNGMNQNYVRALTAIGTDLYAGGGFTTAGGVSTNYIAKWDGASWSALGNGMNQYYVRALTTIGGDLYAGGDFTMAGGVSANYIAKYSCSDRITSIDNSETETVLPMQFNLEQNYPNPFNPTSTIRYDIPKTSFINISVYDILGKEIKVLVNEVKSPGTYEAVFNANGLASGIYFYTIKSGDFFMSKKMILLK